MQTYTLTLDCETCGDPMANRITDLSADPDQELEIDLDTAVSQVEFSCDRCGGITAVGDLDDICLHEPGTEPEVQHP